MSDAPRRCFLDKMTPAEKAIRDAVLAVEDAGCDVRLTNAVVLLSEAQAWVGDFVDGVDPADHYPRAAPAPSTTRAPETDCGCDEGGLCERHRIEGHSCGEHGPYCDSDVHRAVTCGPCGSAAWVATMDAGTGVIALACARCGATPMAPLVRASTTRAPGGGAATCACRGTMKDAAHGTHSCTPLQRNEKGEIVVPLPGVLPEERGPTLTLTVTYAGAGPCPPCGGAATGMRRVATPGVAFSASGTWLPPGERDVYRCARGHEWPPGATRGDGGTSDE